MTRSRLLSAAAAATAGAALLLFTTPAAYADPAAPQPLTAERIASYAAEQFDAAGLPGLSLVVTHDGDVLYADGFGHDANGEPVTASSPMRVASVSKSFTATAVMQLVESGAIRLDAPVAGQLPGFAMADERAGDITVAHLLHQTSGITDQTVDVIAAGESPDLASYVATLRDGTLATDPGEHWAYCNVNYDLLARLVEVASGQSFPDYMEEHVFAPLGMSGSAVLGAAPDGYIELFGQWFTAEELLGGGYAGGSGQVVTTAADMGRWLAAQQGHGPEIVSPESLEAMHTAAEGTDYGMGWGVDATPDGAPMIRHGGNLFTYTAGQAFLPDSGYGFAVMTNSSAVYDGAYVIIDGLVEMTEGRAAATSGGLWTTEAVLGGLTVLVAALGVLGALRAPLWAARRRRRPLWRAVLRCGPYALPVALFAFWPQVAAVIVHRTTTWEQCWYRAPSLFVLLALGAAAALAVTGLRVLRLANLNR